jgi:hypothetical protein
MTKVYVLLLNDIPVGVYTSRIMLNYAREKLKSYVYYTISTVEVKVDSTDFEHLDLENLEN